LPWPNLARNRAWRPLISQVVQYVKNTAQFGLAR
jgi:hypothetical protein